MDVTIRANPAPLSGNGSTGETPLTKAAASAHGAVDKVADAAEQVVNKARPAIERVAQAAHQTVDRVADVAGPTAEWLSEQSAQLQATRQNLVDDTCKYVAAHPVKSLGFALAAGFLLGRFAR